MTKYYVEVNFLTGGWSVHWDSKNGFDNLADAIKLAKKLSELYLSVQVSKHEIVWNN